MKNFLEALDTNKEIAIEMQLVPISENGFPDILVKICDEIVHDGSLTQKKNIHICKDVQDFISFEIKLRNKQYNKLKETACVIEKISIDGYEIIPIYQHLCAYENDHYKKISTSYLGFNGTWKLDIDKPFYIWYHEISGQGMLI